MAPSEQRFSVITERSLSELSKLINVPIEDTLEPWCYEASARQYPPLGARDR